MRWFHKHSGKVLTTTKTMVEDLKSHGFNGDIIPWTRGVQKSIFRKDLRDTNRPTDVITLLNVGRVSREKGIDDFCKLEINTDKQVNKIVVGDGPYLEELRKKYPKISFVGSKKGVELAKYYANADVFVFPSKVDTFGIVIIESLSVGTPVAAYRVPGPIDILEQSVDGVMGDDLVQCVHDCLNLDRNAVAESGDKWTWDNCWNIFKTNLISAK